MRDRLFPAQDSPIKEVRVKSLAGNIHFKSVLFDFQLLRALHHSRYGGPDIGECLAICLKIEEGNPEDWLARWTSAGERWQVRAEEFLAHKNLASARRAFLRAFECHRSAAYFLLGNPGDPVLLAVVEKMQRCFRRAGELMDGRMRILSIPYEGTTLPGYFIQPENRPDLCPTLIINTGYTSFCEEAYFLGGVAALERGWNILLYDGPGQGSALIRQGLHFRPDWENVLTPLLNHAETLPGVAPQAFAVFGRSFNSLLSLRAIAKEARVAAFLADPGEYNKYRDVVRDFPLEIVTTFEQGNDQPLIDYLAEKLKNPDLLFSYQCRMQAHGTATPVEYIRELKKYDFTASLEDLRCPTAISCADHDDRGTEQARGMFDLLNCEKVYFPFCAEDGAGEHCQLGAPELCYQTFYDWLEKIFNSEPPA